MLDSLFHPEKDDAINILKADHDKVDALFKEFENKDRKRTKAAIIAETLDELRMHTVIEEEIFYPTVRPRLEKAMMNEANEEHHVAKILIAELAVMKGTEEHYEAKFTVLSENIRHHVKEEEHDMFPAVRSLDLDLVKLGQKMLARKADLMENGIPVTAEELLLQAVGARKIDSPALAVQNKASAKKAATTKKQAANTNKKPAAKSNVAALRAKPVSTKAPIKKTTRKA